MSSDLKRMMLAICLIAILSLSSVLLAAYHRDNNSQVGSNEIGVIGGAVDPNVSVCMGDSITEGVYLTNYTSYPGILGRFIGGDVYNSGISGQTTSQMVARFESDVLAHHPAKLILLGGTNDILRGGTAATVEANLTKMVDAGLNSGAKVFLLTIPPSIDFTSSQNDIKSTVNGWITSRASANVTVVDINTPLANGTKLLAAYDNGDGLHPNSLGMSVIAKSIVLAGQAKGFFKSTKFWASREDGTASSPANWAGGVAPVAGDRLVFDSSSVKNCLLDQSLTYGSISTISTYTGFLTLAACIGTTDDQVLLGGTFTGSIIHNDACAGRFIQAGANITEDVLNLFMNGNNGQLKVSPLRF